MISVTCNFYVVSVTCDFYVVSVTGIMKELGTAESELLFSVVQVASVATAAHVYKWELGMSCKNVEAIDEVLVVSLSLSLEQLNNYGSP